MTTTTAPEGTGERSTEGRGTGQPAGPLVRGSRARAQRDRRDVLRPRLPVRGAGDHRHGRGRAQRPVRLRQPRERDRLARQRARGRGTLCGLPRFAWVPSWKPGGPMATHFAKQAVARTGSSATPADIPILPSKITAPGVPGLGATAAADHQTDRPGQALLPADRCHRRCGRGQNNGPGDVGSD